MTADPLAAPCFRCGATPGQRCMMLSDYARKPHAARRKLALVLAAHADSALDAYFPRLGPCGICSVPGLDQRHRVVDAIADRLAAGEDPREVAEDYVAGEEAIRAVSEWSARWPGAWS